MSKKKYQKPFVLDMPFDVALLRFAQTNPTELPPPPEKRKKNRKNVPLSIPDRATETVTRRTRARTE